MNVTHMKSENMLISCVFTFTAYQCAVKCELQLNLKEEDLALPQGTLWDCNA